MQAIDQTMNNMTLETNIGGHNLECHNDMVSHHNSFEQKPLQRKSKKNFKKFSWFLFQSQFGHEYAELATENFYSNDLALNGHFDNSSL